jgi:hypothetical protein
VQSRRSRSATGQIICTQLPEQNGAVSQGFRDFKKDNESAEKCRVIFSFNYIHVCSGNHPASYPMGTRGSFSGDKAAGA